MGQDARRQDEEGAHNRQENYGSMTRPFWEQSAYYLIHGGGSIYIYLMRTTSQHWKPERGAQRLDHCDELVLLVDWCVTTDFPHVKAQG